MHYERKNQITAVAVAELILGIALAVLGVMLLLRLQTEPEKSLALPWLSSTLLALGGLQFFLGLLGILVVTYDHCCGLFALSSGTLLVVLYQVAVVAAVFTQGNEYMQIVRQNFQPANCTQQMPGRGRPFLACPDDSVAMEEAVNRMIGVFVAGLAVIQCCTLLCTLCSLNRSPCNRKV
ncbi:hypothetical protein SprV_0802512400 [Sparganum proliferum]